MRELALDHGGEGPVLVCRADASGLRQGHCDLVLLHLALAVLGSHDELAQQRGAVVPRHVLKGDHLPLRRLVLGDCLSRRHGVRDGEQPAELLLSGRAHDGDKPQRHDLGAHCLGVGPRLRLLDGIGGPLEHRVHHVRLAVAIVGRGDAKVADHLILEIFAGLLAVDGGHPIVHHTGHNLLHIQNPYPLVLRRGILKWQHLLGGVRLLKAVVLHGPLQAGHARQVAIVGHVRAPGDERWAGHQPCVASHLVLPCVCVCVCV